jgi:hypothetical protein
MKNEKDQIGRGGKMKSLASGGCVFIGGGQVLNFEKLKFEDGEFVPEIAKLDDKNIFKPMKIEGQ